jgi:hypothetical protein
MDQKRRTRPVILWALFSLSCSVTGNYTVSGGTEAEQIGTHKGFSLQHELGLG